jgi:hypothetical protein
MNSVTLGKTGEKNGMIASIAADGRKRLLLRVGQK